MPNEEDASKLLEEIRERAIQIENASLGLLMKSMRVRPSGNNSPTMRPFIITLSVILLLGILAYIVNYMLNR